jgi:pimeloyl-ACP methyl ester carboxylesterase
LVAVVFLPKILYRVIHGRNRIPWGRIAHSRCNEAVWVSDTEEFVNTFGEEVPKDENFFPLWFKPKGTESRKVVLVLGGFRTHYTQYQTIAEPLALLGYHAIVCVGPGNVTGKSFFHKARHVEFGESLLRFVSAAQKRDFEVSIVGHSKGGVDASYIAIRAETPIDRLVLLDPAYGISPRRFMSFCIRSYEGAFLDRVFRLTKQGYILSRSAMLNFSLDTYSDLLREKPRCRKLLMVNAIDPSQNLFGQLMGIGDNNVPDEMVSEAYKVLSANQFEEDAHNELFFTNAKHDLLMGPALGSADTEREIIKEKLLKIFSIK